MVAELIRKALTYVEQCILKQFFTDDTGRPYSRHGRIFGMKDAGMSRLFEEDKYLAEVYLKELGLMESLTAIVCETLGLSYNRATQLLREYEDEKLLQAMKKGLERSTVNKEKWSADMRLDFEPLKSGF